VPLSNTALIAELPCGATVSVRNEAQMDSAAEHASLMKLVESHQSGCVRCRAFPPGAGGVTISRRH
jgi:hypothetical protein